MTAEILTFQRKVPAVGPVGAKVMIVGEAPGKTETEEGGPFRGSSGQELTRMLAEAGIDREACFITNVCKYRPLSNDIEDWFYTKTEAKKQGIPELFGRYPDPRIVEGVKELAGEIQAVQPNLIIALGATALWALTGKQGIGKYRGSVEASHRIFSCNPGYKVLAAYHPAYILRVWGDRRITVQDFRRAKEESAYPEIRRRPYQFILRPSFSEVMDTIKRLELLFSTGNVCLAHDVETYGGQIACHAIAWSPEHAICIPWMSSPGKSYFTSEEEFIIIRALRRMYRHPNHKPTGHNYLYDAQYMALQYGIDCRNTYMDTMITHHLLWPALPKALDFISSMYCEEYHYWKEDGKEFDWAHHTPEQYWAYNCEDAARTYECGMVLDDLIDSQRLGPQFDEQHTFFRNALTTMLEGVATDAKGKLTLQMELLTSVAEIEHWLASLIPLHPKLKPWYRSPKQQQELFYEHFGQKIIKKDGRPTCNDDAINKIGKREPLLRPITDSLEVYRSLNAINNSLSASVDLDGRMRCSYNVAGTTTFRLSSSTNPFGSGTNLQNLTTGANYTQDRKYYLPVGYKYPNVRRTLVPDPGHIMFEPDLERADAAVVAWEAGDEELKAIFREGADLHTENAKALFGPVLGLQEAYRHKAKAGVHAVNYGVQAGTLSEALGLTVKEAQDFINRWFGAHPKIRDWHTRVRETIESGKAITNAFGYRINFLDRPESVFSEALAWVPQSTVAIVSLRGWANLVANLPWVKVLLQTHDSITAQCRIDKWGERAKIREQLLITVPYDDPLVIQIGLKASEVSWGDCKKASWDPAEDKMKIISWI